jgi:hypothetical protein
MDFAWLAVFDPHHFRLRWYSEHAYSVLRMLTRSPATLIRLALPWVFWMSVTLSHPILLGRLVLWIVMMFVVLHVIAAIPFGYYNWVGLDQWQFGSIQLSYQAYGVPGLLAMLSNALFSPIVHFIDLGRLTATYFGNGPIYLNSVSDLLAGSVLVFGFSTTWLIVLVAIPTTRKLAKIRVRHILRAYIISMLPAIILFQVLRVESAYGMMARTTPSGVLPLALLVSILWLITFWASAVRVGWRIRHAWAMIVLGTIAGLLGMLVSVLIPAVYL